MIYYSQDIFPFSLLIMWCYIMIILQYPLSYKSIENNNVFPVLNLQSNHLNDPSNREFWIGQCHNISLEI